MKKYTDLEQALRDSSLAIITDRLTTQRELNRVFVKYRALPKRNNNHRGRFLVLINNRS